MYTIIHVRVYCRIEREEKSVSEMDWWRSKVRSLITQTKTLLFIPWAYLKRTNNGRFIFQIIYIGCRFVWFSYHKTEVQCSAKNGTKSHRTTLQTLLPRFIRHRAITCCKFYYIIFFNLKKLNETSIIILEKFINFIE